MDICSPITIGQSNHRLTSQAADSVGCETVRLKAKFHYAILVADRSEAGRRPAVSWNLAYYLAR